MKKNLKGGQYILEKCGTQTKTMTQSLHLPNEFKTYYI